MQENTSSVDAADQWDLLLERMDALTRTQPDSRDDLVEEQQHWAGLVGPLSVSEQIPILPSRAHWKHSKRFPLSLKLPQHLTHIGYDQHLGRVSSWMPRASLYSGKMKVLSEGRCT